MDAKDHKRIALRTIKNDLRAELREAHALIPLLSQSRELDKMMVYLNKAEMLEDLIKYVDEQIVATYAPGVAA